MGSTGVRREVVGHVRAGGGEGVGQDAGHGQHAGAGVEAVAVGLEQPGPPAGHVGPLEDLDVVAPPGQVAGGRQPAQAGADDDDPHRRDRSRCVATAATACSAAFTSASTGSASMAATASAHSDSMSASISSTAPEATRASWRRGDVVVVEVGGAVAGEDGGVGAGRRGATAMACSSVGLPSRRSSPTGLPVTRRVAEHAEQVVAQLEGLAEGQAEGRQRRRPARRAGRPGRRRGAAAARPCTCPTCSGECARPAPVDAAPRAVPSRSRYWPTLSSIRSSVNTRRARGGRVGEQLVGVDEGQVADEDGHALAEAPGLAPPAAALVRRR